MVPRGKETIVEPVVSSSRDATLLSYEGRAFCGDRLRLGKLLGAGGMGGVFEGTLDGRTSSVVAVKVLLDFDRRALARFRQEALIATRIIHANVVRTFELLEDGSLLFLVMERLAGENLGTVLRREGVLEPKRAVAIAIQMLDGLSAAHALGAIHRDIKPANIFLAEPDASVKILDFGIAKLIFGEGAEVYKTTTGILLGTPAYMAPEQILGLAVDERTDVHAVGLCLYEMLSGVRPRGRPNQDPLPLPSNVSSELTAIVLRAIARPPDDRFPTARAMADALRAKKSTSSKSTSSSSSSTPTARGAKIATVTFALGAVALVCVLVFARLRAAPPSSPPASSGSAAAPSMSALSSPPVIESVASVAPDLSSSSSSSSSPLPPSARSHSPSGAHSAHAPVVSGSPTCLCNERGVRAPLCFTNTPGCVCMQQKERYDLPNLCRDPWELDDFGRYVCRNYDFGTNLKDDGQGCLGVPKPKTKPPQDSSIQSSELQAGVLYCAVCTHSSDRRSGVEGSPCTGFDYRTGARREGFLRCDY